MASLEAASRSNKRSDRSTVSVADPSSVSRSFLGAFRRAMTLGIVFRIMKRRFITLRTRVPIVNGLGSCLSASQRSDTPSSWGCAVQKRPLLATFQAAQRPPQIICLLISNELNQADGVWVVHDPYATWAAKFAVMHNMAVLVC